ncbi:hypothetical protein [Cytobacillus massiliigabonensis]|uniref:hypothetical protein n=1 Tax=Cytobacillus massiliigabonensis TaxID=1871011 RepID=UPI000C868126|nr:hypothetical protein [Cytobacillus massiliigabonensis]
MTKWLEKNKNTVLIAILFLFLLLFVFYFFMLRPLAAEEKNQLQELNRINEDASFYEQAINKLESQVFTDEEKQQLLASIPVRPNVEELIKDIERTELETGAVIDSVTFNLNSGNPSGLENRQNSEMDAETPAEESQNINEEQVNGTIQNLEGNDWDQLLPAELLAILKEKYPDLYNLDISYIEMMIDVNGEVEDVNRFVSGLENLKRTTHIQTYEYSINEEKENRLEGIVTIRAFYSQDFANFIDDDTKFELDYEFDPRKIKRYIDLEASKPSQTNEDNSLTMTDMETEINGDELEEAPLVGVNADFGIYQRPDSKTDGIKNGDPVFHVVQTGVYTSTKYLNLAIENLVKNGIHPRIIGDEMSYIYTATDNSVASAQKIVDVLRKQGFESYVKTLPYRLTEDETVNLLPEAEEVVASITKLLTDGIIDGKISITEEQLNIIQLKRNSYETKIHQMLEKGVNEGRKQELLETISILSQIEQIFQNGVTDGQLESLWEIEGLILDYMLIFNSYVPVNIK